MELKKRLQKNRYKDFHAKSPYNSPHIYTIINSYSTFKYSQLLIKLIKLSNLNNII